MKNRKKRRRLSDADEFEVKTEETIEKETEAARNFVRKGKRVGFSSHIFI